MRLRGAGMTQQFRRRYRGYLVDHHSPEPPVVTLSRLDAEEYVAAHETAHLDYAMLYCKDHCGVTYHDTSVPDGKKHLGLAHAVTGGDLIGTMSRRWHARSRASATRRASWASCGVSSTLATVSLANSSHHQPRPLDPLTCLHGAGGPAQAKEVVTCEQL